MNRLHARYLVISAISVAASAILVQWLLLSLLVRDASLLAGAAFIAGYLGALVAAGTVAIIAGRKAAEGFVDPRIGWIAGIAVGIWVGVGSIIGQVIAGLGLLIQVPNAELRPGLVVVFGLVCFVVSVIAAGLTGRETAQPPEVEEE
ncbi:MAG: hypothetical protein RMM31_01400 [Anaerolineae bacterium]|nr:hypothetical protein [Thermoflexales bacterium]MDW8394879.1 hypothetical protein [Anaerolineae bacterium]